MVKVIHQETGLSISHLTEQTAPLGGVVRPRHVEMERTRLQELGIQHQTPFKQGLMEALKPYM